MFANLTFGAGSGKVLGSRKNFLSDKGTYMTSQQWNSNRRERQGKIAKRKAYEALCPKFQVYVPRNQQCVCGEVHR